MNQHDPFSIAALLSFPLAALIAVSSLGGILSRSTYAQETALYAAQGVGQDWVDLLLVTPLLLVSAHRALRGSRLCRLLLGGTLLYALYSFVIYSFSLHFNSLFLVYCAELGLSFYALLCVGAGFYSQDTSAWFSDRAPVRVTAGFLLLIAATFYFMWLSEIVPALMTHSLPKSLVEAGLVTNPVYVLDLAVVLPALVTSAISLLRRRALGYCLAPLMLTFATLMAAAIAAMVVAMHLRGLSADLGVAKVFGVVTLLTLIVLFLFLRGLNSPIPAHDTPRNTP